MRGILLLCFLSTSFVFAGNQEVFREGNVAYEKGDYSKAKEFYEQLVEDENLSMALFYNLGNTYFKLGEYAHAILYLEKAKVYAPFDDDIDHNLEYANQFISDKRESSEDISNWWARFLQSADMATYSLISLIPFFFSTVGFICFFLFNRSSYKRIGFYGGSTFLIAFFVVWLLALQRKKLEENASHAIIMKPTVSILTEPTEVGKAKFTLHEGSKVQVLDKQKKWARVSFSENQIGWIKNTSLEEI